MSAFSIEPQRLEELLKHCVGFAKQMIGECGEFYPFGAVISASGALAAVGGHVGDEHPDAGKVYLLLQNAMKAQFLKGEIVAAALAANVTVPAQFKQPFPDGIRVLLECSGY